MKIGDKVLIISGIGYSNTVKTSVEKKLSATITMLEHKYLVGHHQVEVFSDRKEFIRIKDLAIIEKNDYAKYDKILENYKADTEKKLKALITNLEKKPAKVLNWEHKDKALNTNINFFTLGTIKKDGEFRCSEDTFFEDCAQATKTTDDIRVYIPQIWLNHMGYSETDLKAWLVFLSKCDIGFEYTYDGIVDSPDDELGNNLYEEKYDLNSFNKDTQTGHIIPVENWYQITLKGSSYEMITYLRYICLRYIYNHQYYSIPGTAMQIKKALGRKITYVQALLMTHLRTYYNDYYSLATQYGSKHLNPLQDFKVIIGKLQENKWDEDEEEWTYNMNEVWEYSCNYDRKELDKFFKEQDWEGLFNYIKEKNATTNIK